MRGAPVVIALALASLPQLATAAAATPSHVAMYRGVPKAALIAAAKVAPLKLIDALQTYCDTDTAIAAWLKQLTGAQVRRIAWTAGSCDLVDSLNPLDAGGSYCVQATLTLKHPKDRRDTPELEIYLEDAKRGKPGAVYAFRAVFDSNEGADYIRFRKDFEAEWRARFKDAPAPSCSDDQ
jgi:hypothetical protein